MLLPVVWLSKLGSPVGTGARPSAPRPANGSTAAPKWKFSENRQSPNSPNTVRFIRSESGKPSRFAKLAPTSKPRLNVSDVSFSPSR
jgi:hypothetical protein